MGALTGRQIVELVSSGELVIDPFDEELVEPATYDLRLGDTILASPLGPGEHGEIIQLNEDRELYDIETGQMVAVMSYERLELPLNIVSNCFGIKSYYARRGLNAFGGVHLDPGWHGHVMMNLQNVGPEPVTLKRREPLFTVSFEKLGEPASRGYEGAYQNQDTFPDDQVEFILTARTTSLAEIPTLRAEIATLKVVIEQLREYLPDPDEGLELKPQVEQRLLNSLKTPDDEMLSPEEAWDRFGA